MKFLVEADKAKDEMICLSVAAVEAEDEADFLDLVPAVIDEKAVQLIHEVGDEMQFLVEAEDEADVLNLVLAAIDEKAVQRAQLEKLMSSTDLWRPHDPWRPHFEKAKNNEFHIPLDNLYTFYNVFCRVVQIGLKVDPAIWNQSYVYCGCGWIHSDNVTVITTAHVLVALSKAITNPRVRGVEYVVVDPIHSSDSLRANVVMVASRRSDVGLLFLPSPYNAGGPPLTIASSDPEVDLPVIVYGRPCEVVEAATKRLHPGTFKFDDFNLEAELQEIVDGMPIVDLNGTVVGITSVSNYYRGKVSLIGIKSRCIVDTINYVGDNIVSTSIPADGRKNAFLKGVSHALNQMGMDDLADEFRKRKN